MLGSLFDRIPIIKILVPYILGIIIACTQLLPLLVAVVCFFIFVSFYFVSFKIECFDRRILFRSIIIYLIVFAVSWILSGSRMPDFPTIHKGDVCLARIDKLNVGENSINAYSTVTSRDHTFKSLITMQGNDYSISEGSIICFLADFDTIRNNGNPCEFDYASFMRRKGVLLEQYLPEHTYRKIGEDHTLSTIALRVRRILENYILKSNMSQKAQDFIIATTLGDKDIIDEDVRLLFTSVGVAHLLALSGLHVGIICVIIFFLLFPLDFCANGKKWKYSIGVLVLIGYAFITGFSPSVTRAVVMAIMVAIGFVVHRRVVIANSLVAAALVILVIEPMTLFDVGFQLSFAAVASILMFANLLNPISVKQKMMRRVLNLVIMAIVPVLTTGILTMYYFNSFSPMFFVANLLLVPFFPIVIYLGLIAVISNAGIFLELYEFVYTATIRLLEFISDYGIPSFDNIYVTFVDLLLYFFLLTLLFFVLIYRKRSLLFVSAPVLALWLFLLLMRHVPESPAFVIFNSYDCTPALLINKGVAYTYGLSNTEDVEEFKFYNRTFLAKYKVDKFIPVTSLISPAVDVNLSENSAFVNGKSYVFVSKTIKGKRCPNKNFEPLKVDYLVVTHTYYGKIARLLTFYHPNVIVFSGAIQKNRLDNLKTECRKSDIPYFEISASGAFFR